MFKKAHLRLLVLTLGASLAVVCSVTSEGKAALAASWLQSLIHLCHLDAYFDDKESLRLKLLRTEPIRPSTRAGPIAQGPPPVTGTVNVLHSVGRTASCPLPGEFGVIPCLHATLHRIHLISIHILSASTSSRLQAPPTSWASSTAPARPPARVLVPVCALPASSPTPGSPGGSWW